jgi:hypothetical protein
MNDTNVSKFTFAYPSSISSISKIMNNRENHHNNNSLIPTLPQFWKDFCSWIRGHEKLYQCLLKIKHFILDNAILLFCLLFLYYRFSMNTSDNDY